jgi:hypothetical protein
MNPDIEQHIQALQTYATAATAQPKDTSDLRIKRSQLSAIQKTIRSLEKKSVPVPEVLQNEKLSLTTAVAELERTGDDGADVYEALLEIVSKLGYALGRRPHNELYKKIRDWRRLRTPQKPIRDALLAVMKAMGGSGQEPDILERLTDKLGDKLTPSDLDKPYGRRPRWHTTVRSVRNKLIKEGLLTPESRRRTWTLAK